MTHARCPSSWSAASSRLASPGRRSSPSGRRRSSSDAPTTAPSGRRARRRRSGSRGAAARARATSGSRPRAPVDVRHGRDRGADEAPLPARRRDGQLLQLRPAVRLGEDALAERVGERVDRDPVVGSRGGAAEELPASAPARLRSVRWRVVNANQRASSSGSRRRRSATTSSSAGDARRDGSLEGATDRRPERRADAVRRPDARRDEAPGPRGTRGRRARANAAESCAANASGSCSASARPAPSSVGALLACRDRRRAGVIARSAVPATRSAASPSSRRRAHRASITGRPAWVRRIP